MINFSMRLWFFLGLFAAQDQAAPPAPESRAIAFLAREVPRWPRDNHCYSCHNNGDAARALYLAVRSGWHVPAESLAETDRWLSQPKEWDHNGGEGPHSDKRLARLVFTATMATAVQARSIKDNSVRDLAAAQLAHDQCAEGYWPLEGEDSLSSPATYGRLLSTFMARQALAETHADRFEAAIARADGWLWKQDIVTVTDAAVCLMVCGKLQSPAAVARRKRGLDLLRRGQSADGGWGQRTLSPSEPFDTALALLGLEGCPTSEQIKGMIARGRAFLIAEQLEDGSWVETTRPPGNVSYAQRISTCGWATMALLATQNQKRPLERPSDEKKGTVTEGPKVPKKRG
jgi:hypothetical protein